MTWFLRFIFGLPARPEDVAELRQQVPEFFEQGREWLQLPRVLPVWFFDQYSNEFIRFSDDYVGAVQAWIARAEEHQTPEPPQPSSRQPERCEHPECPRKASILPSEEPAESEPLVLRMMAVAGGPGQKPLLGRFIDTVQKVHAGAGNAIKVIVTDSYLMSDLSESGKPGGFQNFCAYLSSLRLAPKATLFVTPGPKNPSRSREQWIKAIEMRFPGLMVKSFSSRLSFHDRFYIVEHEGGGVRGVFGPSMSGLSATDIALIGELEIPDALDTLVQWFDLNSEFPERYRHNKKRHKPKRTRRRKKRRR